MTEGIKMKFLLLNTHKWEPVSPPAALDYVAWELEKMGISSQVADVAFMGKEELAALLEKNHYDGVCLTIRNLEKTAFSETLHFPLLSVRELVQMVREYCDGPIIVGGNGFSILPERALEYTGADYGIAGAGEEALPLLVEYLFKKRGDLRKIPYLVYNWEGKVKQNPGFPYQKRLPPVRRGYFDYNLYFHPGFEHFSGFASVETKRGCPHRCVYCVEPAIKGTKVRVKPPEDVTKEVEWFINREIPYFFLADSEFNADSTAAVELLNYWKERGYHRKIKWMAYCTPSGFSDELAQSTAQSGNLCTMIDFGHISDKMLSNLGKNYTAKDVEEVISSCQDHGLNFRGSLMLGGPGESPETVKEAVDFFKGVDCKVFLVVGIRVFPHTPLGVTVRKSGSLMDNCNLYGKVIDNDDLFEPVYYISEELGPDVFTYLQDLVGTSEQFYTVSPPFRLSRTMHGCFRGVTPEYEITGCLNPKYITKLPEKEAISVFGDE